MRPGVKLGMITWGRVDELIRHIVKKAQFDHFRIILK